MPLFVIERNFAEELDPEALDYDEIRLVNDDEGVSWVYSFLSADKKKTYCLYEAPSPEAIRAAAERLGHPGRRDRAGRAVRSGPDRLNLPRGARSAPATTQQGAPPMTVTSTARPAHRRDARPLRRAGPDLRPGEPVLHRGLRGAQAAGYLLATVPDELGGPGVGLDEYVAARSPASRYVAPADRAGGQHALLLDGRSPPTWPSMGDDSLQFVLEKAAAGRGVRRPPRRGRQRHARCCCRRPGPSGPTVAG